MKDLDGKPYLALGYANGPGYTKHRRNNGTHITRRSPEEFGDELCKNYIKIMFLTERAPACTSTRSLGRGHDLFRRGSMKEQLLGLICSINNVTLYISDQRLTTLNSVIHPIPSWNLGNLTHPS